MSHYCKNCGAELKQYIVSEEENNLCERCISNNTEDKIEHVKKFLKELSDLTLKYGIEIAGCGCCNSPYLSYIDEEIIEPFEKGYYDDKLEWDDMKKRYVY